MIKRALSVAIAAILAAAPGLARSDLRGDWSLYIDYTFAAESSAISDVDRTKARRVADYLDRNPSLQVGLDGMNQHRVFSVRDALLGAGVPSSKIRIGAFAEPRLRGERRVLVMIGP
jgi:hypothetical protein